MRKVIILCLKKQRFMRISLDELMNENIIMKKPYQR